MEGDTETARDEQLSQDANTDTAREPSVEGNADKRVSDAQAKLHEATQEKARMQRELDELKGKVEAVMQLRGPGEAKVEDKPKLFAYLESDSGDEDILDSTTNLKGFMRKFAGDIAALLSMRDQALRGDIEKNSPIAGAMTAKLAELKARPEFAGLDEGALAKIASNMVTPVRGPAGGGRGPARPSGQTDLEKLADEFEARMNPGRQS